MIRRVTEADAAAIADIYNEYVLHTTISFETEAVSTEKMKERIRTLSTHYPWFVWEAGGTILGYCYAHPWKERAAYAKTWETTVYLAKTAQRQGIGKQLMQKLIHACHATGCRALIACITHNNSASARFHESLGFRQVSHFTGVGFKFGQMLDVSDYELQLPSEE